MSVGKQECKEVSKGQSELTTKDLLKAVNELSAEIVWDQETQKNEPINDVLTE